MTGVLCLDFGTSSVRAVRRQPSGKLKPLAIGRVARSRLDDASIRSEVHIDSTGKQVRFGDAAVRQWAKGEGALLFELSPKMWLRELDRIDQPAAAGTPLTRQDLLVGLLANAIRAAAEADGIGFDTLRKLDLRIAHPVWENSAAEASAVLARIAVKARQVAFQRDWSSVSASTLKDWSSIEVADRPAMIEVVEPIAAAVELLPSEENLIRLCAVVDVGAGTTDIALFRSLVPDPDSAKRSRLIPYGVARSVFQAGNQVDAIVLELLKQRTGTHDPVQWASVRGRIRFIKEALFTQGYVQELGVHLGLRDVETHPAAAAMADAVRAALDAAVQACEKDVQLLMNRASGAVQELDLVLAGGGAQMAFLRSALSPGFVVGGKTLRVRITDPQERAGVETFGAGRARMAVSLGGANEEYDLLQTQETKPDRYRRGSY